MPNCATRQRAFQRALIVVLSMVSAAFTTAQAPGQAATADTYVVRGRLIFSDNLPASNMEVSLSTDAQRWVIGPVLSNADGSFRFDHLAAGRYFVMAYSLAQGGHIWGQTPTVSGSFQATTITVGPEVPVGEVTFRMDRRAKVYGTIRDANGDPTSAAVYALRRAWAFGRPYLLNARQGSSDDTGNFRLWDLPAGRYRFCAVLNRPVPPTANADFNGPASYRIAIGDCPSEGPFVEIRPGEERRIDLSSRVVSALPVRVSTKGKPMAGQVEFLPRYGPNETRNLFGAPTLSASQYGIKAISYYPAGRYWLRSISPERTTSGLTEVSVTPNGPNAFELVLGATPLVNLEVTVPPGYDKSAVRVGLHDANDPGAAILDANTQLTYGAPTSPSKITIPYPGRYWLVTRSELCPSRAQAGSIDLLTQPLTLVAGQVTTIAVKFEKTCATVGGHVKSGANPEPGARVAILISGSPQDPGDVLVDSADDQGEFKFTGIAPGTYWLWAWTKDDEENGGIDSLGDIAAHGRMVRLALGEGKRVDLRVLQIARRSAR